PTEGDVDVVEGQTPTEGDVDVVEGQTPTEGDVDVVEGQTPTEGDLDVVEGQTPTEGDVDVVEGQTPTEGDVDVVEGGANDNASDDSATVGETTPSDGSDEATDTTAQDLEFIKNTTDNTISPNTEGGSTNGMDSEPVSTKLDVAGEEAVTPTQDEGSTATESTDNLDSEPVSTESDVAQEEASTKVDSQITSETQNSEESTESKEIIEELVEEVELKEKLSASTEEEEVPTEELEEKPEIEETSQEEEEVAEEKTSEPDLGQLDRVAYETQFQEAPNDLAILMQEEFQLTQLMDSSGLELYGTIPSVQDISRRLAQLAQQTGKKPAFINISLQSNQLESFVVLPEQNQANLSNSLVASSDLNVVDPPQSQSLAVRKTVKNTSRKNLLATATQFREEVSDVRKLGQASYMESAQELYKVLIEPIEAELEANDIDILVFSMDSGLRLLPLAALHDGNQYLVEKYAMGMVPSFGLTDTRYVSPEQSSILAMGASEFQEQAALPTMPIELNTIVSNPRQGELFLNEQFTIPNFVAQNSRETPFSIIHLGTHAEFKAGNLNDSYIQFYDDKLKIPQLQKLSDELGWSTSDTPIELLVLSACETALGDKEAELGFAGLAVQAGVKSALASLWYVSDLGTLALMGEFYDQLSNTLIKAEALRQTQLEMIRGNVKVDNRQVRLSKGSDLPLPEDFPNGTLTLAHPYFWSSFTLIGNWN
ncbi:MAG: CHAT domain-containing protein, partial [Cyanobacteria bacterium P01_G01_bin.67]